jgi:lipoprotein-anchoring transpeptidase ErfK/SrfK
VRPRRSAAALWAASALLAGGCVTVTGPQDAEQLIEVTPRNGAGGVTSRDALRVRVTEGRLAKVKVSFTDRGPRGTGDGARGAGRSAPRHPSARQAVPGAISADGRTWQPAKPARRLAPGSEYRVDVVALDGEGRRSARSTAFTTKSRPRRFLGVYTPEHGQTVGTGMIISLRFTRPVTERAAVERAVRVSADPEVDVVGHWFGGTRLDFRPEKRWAPGTRVTLDLRLRGVRGAPGVYGKQHKRVRFDVGREQRAVVDAAKHTMTIVRGGRVVDRVPVTTGSAENPTYTGDMVISEKSVETRMNARTVGFGREYDIDDVPHAMRLTDSGTFLHGNYWAPRRTFGERNVSHGCIGLLDRKGGDPGSPAGAFFRSSLTGDVVTVLNSPEGPVDPGNGLNGWNMPWADWVAGSALR